MNVSVDIQACIVFHAYLRLEFVAVIEGIGLFRSEPVARVRSDAGEPVQTCETRRLGRRGNRFGFTIEAFLSRTDFPVGWRLELQRGSDRWQSELPALMEQTYGLKHSSLRARFAAEIADYIARTGIERPMLLDVGGRARSGVEHSRDYRECAVVTFDIVAEDGVDVVGDAHELSRHFPPESVDIVHCISVFEHLLMPWKAAVEMGRVMKTGGIALVHTHQTIGLHDVPWDFYRFSDTSWPGIFNRHTGFEILATDMSGFMHIMTRSWTTRYLGMEASGGFESSSVLVRRIGPPVVAWDVSLPELIATRYPSGPAGGG